MNSRKTASGRVGGEPLAGVPPFAGLPAPILAELTAAARAIEVPAHGVLFEAGQPVREALVLLRGTVERSLRADGDARRVVELAQGPQVLALGELFGGDVYGSSARAVSTCALVALPRTAVQAAIRRDNGFAWRIIQALAAQQRAAEAEAAGSHFGVTGAQRLFDYLVELAGGRHGLAGETTVVLKASKKTIAAHLGMTPETFSRSLRQLSDCGVIVVDGRIVHLQNAALLDTATGGGDQLLRFRRKAKNAGDGDRLTPAMVINLCGRLRMLPQRMAMAWAQVTGGVGAARAGVKLRQMEAEFDRCLARLGRAEAPTAFTGQLAAVAEVWSGYRRCLTAADPAGAGEVLALSEAILDAADRLTRMAEALADVPEVHYVNVAGRNRMLSQRIGKFFVFSDWGLGDGDMARRLEAARAEFEANLDELQRSAASLPELAAQLQAVREQWQLFQGSLEAPAATPRERVILQIQAASERLLRYVDTAVRLYERLAG